MVIYYQRTQSYKVVILMIKIKNKNKHEWVDLYVLVLNTSK